MKISKNYRFGKRKQIPFVRVYACVTIVLSTSSPQTLNFSHSKDDGNEDDDDEEKTNVTSIDYTLARAYFVPSRITQVHKKVPFTCPLFFLALLLR